MAKSALLTFFTLLFSLASFAQVDGLQAEADTLFAHEAWGEAAKLYEQIVQDDSAEQVWNSFRIGQCHRKLGQFEKAKAAYHRSIAKGNLAYAEFQLGMLFAKLSQPDSAFHHLQLSVDGGLTIKSYYETNESLGAYREDSRYLALLEKIDRATHPCQFEPKAREFDFWIGEWKVYNPIGQQSGSSRVELILDECVIFENWTDRFGNQGKSFNMYDASTGIWRQTWVDQNGSWTEFKGEWDGKNMVVTTDDFDDSTSGQRLRRRMTFTPQEDGSVRQHGQRSGDKGETWTTEYDLYYRK